MDRDENCVKFVNSIKRKYQCRNVHREKQWPPCHSNKLIRLELVETEKLVYAKDENNVLESSSRKDKDVSRTPLAYADLLNVKKGEKTVKRVLVTGGAGIGKTTLCVSISEDWANGRLFQQFKLLLLLPLRHKKVSSAGSILELLKLLHSSTKVCDSILSYLEREEGEEVLIIADGWDELDKRDCQEESFLYQLLTGELLSFASVIVTSRSSASLPLHEFMDRFVEVLGFNKENIEEFIRSEFASEHEKAIDLSSQLESNPLIESVCSIPLNCAIVCHLWRTLKEDLPTTMTELYTKLVLNFTLRNVRKLHSYKEIMSMSNFNSFPEGLQQSWWLLCKFAFLALIKNKIVFSQEDLSMFFSEDTSIQNILLFGLLQPAESILETGYGLSFHFLHLTFQEYLAAMHLAKNPLIVCYDQLHELDPDVDLSSIPAIFYAMTSNFTVFWRFFFGIYFQESREHKEEPDMNMVSQHLSAMTEYVGDNLHFWHCAFEAQNETFASNVVRLAMDSEGGDQLIYYGMTSNETIVMDLDFSDVSTAHDCAAVIYLITNFQSLGNIAIDFGESGIRENQIRTLTDALATKHGKLQVNELDLRGNDLTDESVSGLFQRAAVAFNSLRRLTLSSNRIGAESIASILTRSPCNTLSDLDLSHNPLGVPGLQALEDAIQSGLLTKLERLNLKESLTTDADINGALLTTFLDVLSINCPNLVQLDLSQNNLGVPGASALARVIPNLTKGWERRSICSSTIGSKEFRIYLNDTILGDDGFTTLFNTQEKQTYVNLLSLKNNDIHGDRILWLADDSGNCPNFQKVFFTTFYLDSNPLRIEGVVAIGKMLTSSFCHLREVSLSNCQLTTNIDSQPSSSFLSIGSDTHVAVQDVGQQLYQMSQNSTINKLNLSENDFSGEGIHVLSGFLYLCRRLKYLHIEQCQINSSDLKLLLKQLKSSSCTDLKILFIDDNKLNDSGVSALLDHLPSLFPSLNYLFLDGNPVSNRMRRRAKMEILKYYNKDKGAELGGGKEIRTYQALQTQWEVALFLIYDTAMDILKHHCPSIHLEVLGDEEGNTSTKQTGRCKLDVEMSVPTDAAILSNTDEAEEPSFLNEASPKPSVENDFEDYKWISISHPYASPTTISPILAMSCPCGDVSGTLIVNSSTQPDKVSLPDQLPQSLNCVEQPTSYQTCATSTDTLNAVEDSLTVDDLASVQTAVWDGCAKWYNIGLQLGITPGRLDAIKLANQSDPDSCFTATLKEWLSKSELHPSWSSLARSLRAPPVGLEYLAEQLPNQDLPH